MMAYWNILPIEDGEGDHSHSEWWRGGAASAALEAFPLHHSLRERSPSPRFARGGSNA